MMRGLRFFALGACALLAAAASASSWPLRQDEAAARLPNILLIIADDVGVDRVAAYGEHPHPGRTPSIDGLARRGVLFRNVWSNPWCSATRATILTGRYSFRTGVGDIVTRDRVGPGLGTSERTLPKALPEQYRTAFFGKWHLAGQQDGPAHPLECGFDVFAGTMKNISDYRRWTKIVDGEPQTSTVYATTDSSNDAIRCIAETQEPWFVVLSYNAAHKPFHMPPAELHTFDDEIEQAEQEPEVVEMKAATEALDTELGRVLESVDWETTYVLFVSDNGTHSMATTRPFRTRFAKGTLGQGGIRVPLIIAGPGVRSGESAALVNTTDLYATILGIAATPSSAEDSIDLGVFLHDPSAPTVRRFQFSEFFFPNGIGAKKRASRAVSDGRFKLVHNLPADEWELYQLRELWTQDKNLLSRGEPRGGLRREAHHALRMELDRILRSQGSEGSESEDD